MNYTREQKQRIKKSFKPSDRAILRKILNDDDVQVRQIVNGLRRVSPDRAAKIAKALKRKSLVKVLLPEIA